MLRANADPGGFALTYDPYWTTDTAPDDTHRPRDPGSYSNWVHLDYAEIRRQVHFITDDSDDACVHALEPFADHLSSAVTSFHSYWPDRSVSAANALIRLWLASSQDISREELTAAYDICLRISIHGFAPWDSEGRKTFRAIFLRQLSADRNRLPQPWVDAAIELVTKARKAGWHDDYRLLRKASEIAAELQDSP